MKTPKPLHLNDIEYGDSLSIVVQDNCDILNLQPVYISIVKKYEEDGIEKTEEHCIALTEDQIKEVMTKMCEILNVYNN